MNKQRRLTKESINELAKIHTNMPGKREQKKIQKAQFEKVQSLIAKKTKKYKEAQIVCPVKLKEKIAALQEKTNNVMDYLENHGKSFPNLQSSFIDDSGNYRGSGLSHYDTVRAHGNKVGIKIEGRNGNQPIVDDSDIHNFMQKTGLIRVQNLRLQDKISLHIPQKLTSSQLTTVKDLEKQFPNKEIGYAVGSNFDKMSFGSGVRNLLLDHAKQFGQKGASQEGEENMTYQKSKKIKLLKEMFRDERVKKD